MGLTLKMSCFSFFDKFFLKPLTFDKFLGFLTGNEEMGKKVYVEAKIDMIGLIEKIWDSKLQISGSLFQNDDLMNE